MDPVVSQTHASVGVPPPQLLRHHSQTVAPGHWVDLLVLSELNENIGRYAWELRHAGYSWSYTEWPAWSSAWSPQLTPPWWGFPEGVWTLPITQPHMLLR